MPNSPRSPLEGASRGGGDIDRQTLDFILYIIIIIIIIIILIIIIIIISCVAS